MWFEMLKVAHRSPLYTVDTRKYQGWERKGLSLEQTLDAVKSKKVGAGFKKWFFDEEHWRSLFSIPVRPAELVKS